MSLTEGADAKWSIEYTPEVHNPLGEDEANGAKAPIKAKSRAVG